MIQPVQFQIAGAQLQPCLPLAPQQRPAARAQFVQAEWLRHQVVGAPIEAADARVHFLARGQHQHRQIGIESAHLFEHLLAILDRHVQIEDGQVGHLLAKCLHGGPAVVSQREHRCPSASSPRLRNNPSALSSSAINNLISTLLRRTLQPREPRSQPAFPLVLESANLRYPFTFPLGIGELKMEMGNVRVGISKQGKFGAQSLKGAMNVAR